MPNPSAVIHIIIADIFTLFITGIKSSLKHKRHIKPVAAANMQQIFEYLENKKYSCLLLADSFLDEFGDACIGEILQKFISVKIIVLAHTRQVHRLKHLVSIGASAVVSKLTTGAEIEEAILHVQENSGPFYCHRKLQVIASKGEIPEYVNRKKISLSPRQLEVLLLLIDGLTNKLIGVELDLEEGTVKKYRKKINAKIKLSGCTCIFEYAFAMGYITFEKYAKKKPGS